MTPCRHRSGRSTEAQQQHACCRRCVTPLPRCRAKLVCGHTHLAQAWLSGAREAAKGTPQPLSVWAFLALEPQSSEAAAPALRAGCLVSVLGLVRAQLALVQAHAPPALEACMAPMKRALADVAAHGNVSRALRRAAGELAGEVDAAVADTVAARRPLVCPALVKKAPQRLLNPKFEVDFDKRRDYDPDRERSEYREYKRLAAKEKRGALLPPPPWPHPTD